MKQKISFPEKRRTVIKFVKIELDQLCLHHPNNDSNLNSEYAPDDDADIEINVNLLNILQNKEMILNKNEHNALMNRPYTTDHKKPNITRHFIKARDKK